MDLIERILILINRGTTKDIIKQVEQYVEHRTMNRSSENKPLEELTKTIKEGSTERSRS
jgi:hypothetical protein